MVTSLDGKRRNGYTNLGVRPNENSTNRGRRGPRGGGGPRLESSGETQQRPQPEWVRHVTVFDTLEATEITLSVGCQKPRAEPYGLTISR